MLRSKSDISILIIKWQKFQRLEQILYVKNRDFLGSISRSRGIIFFLLWGSTPFLAKNIWSLYYENMWFPYRYGIWCIESNYSTRSSLNWTSYFLGICFQYEAQLLQFRWPMAFKYFTIFLKNANIRRWMWRSGCVSTDLSSPLGGYSIYSKVDGRTVVTAHCEMSVPTLVEKHTVGVRLASSDPQVEHLLWMFTRLFTVGITMAVCFFAMQGWWSCCELQIVTVMRG